MPGVGPSMANRMGARGPGGRPVATALDPLLQPEWASKQEAIKAHQRQQLAVTVAVAKSTQGGGGGKGSVAMEREEVIKMVLRQPSTMVCVLKSTRKTLRKDSVCDAAKRRLCVCVYVRAWVCV